ncbi:hypothetical protein Mapa_011440 [Marchantia paleacea]|nr:hypothetical protein Mapa_011440 [Marchantia paleacea]
MQRNDRHLLVLLDPEARIEQILPRDVDEVQILHFRPELVPHGLVSHRRQPRHRSPSVHNHPSPSRRVHLELGGRNLQLLLGHADARQLHIIEGGSCGIMQQRSEFHVTRLRLSEIEVALASPAVGGEAIRKAVGESGAQNPGELRRKREIAPTQAQQSS